MTAIHVTATLQSSPTNTHVRQNFGWILAGFVAIYVVFEGSVRLLPALSIVRPLSFFVTALAVIATAFAIEMALFKQSFMQAAARLGLGRAVGACHGCDGAFWRADVGLLSPHLGHHRCQIHATQ